MSNTVIEKISQIVGVKQEDVLSKSRKYELAEARQIIAFLMYKNNTLKAIGKVLNRNHSTIIHSIAKINTLKSVGDKRTKMILERFYNNDI